MLMTEDDTVIRAPGTQMIALLTQLVRELKCKIQTNEDGNVELKHPRRGKIHLDQKSGSPIMAEEMCRALIKEMEELSKKKKEQEKEVSNPIASVEQILKVMESELVKDSQAEDEKEFKKQKMKWTSKDQAGEQFEKRKSGMNPQKTMRKKTTQKKQKSIRRQKTQSLKRKTTKKKNRPQTLPFD